MAQEYCINQTDHNNTHGHVSEINADEIRPDCWKIDIILQYIDMYTISSQHVH